jgi:hypothetical protein
VHDRDPGDCDHVGDGKPRGPTTMSDEFTIPNFKACGNFVTTNALNLAISGPGNTFSDGHAELTSRIPKLLV